VRNVHLPGSFLVHNVSDGKQNRGHCENQVFFCFGMYWMENKMADIVMISRLKWPGVDSPGLQSCLFLSNKIPIHGQLYHTNEA